MDTRIQLASTLVLSALLMACTHAKTAEGDDMPPVARQGALRTADGLLPFHAVTFDHTPTEEEMDLELRAFMASRASAAAIDDLGLEDDPSAALPPLSNISPLPGQKLVRVQAYTSNLPDAGTDDANYVRLTAQWATPNGGQYIESFIFDNPSVDDLDAGSVSVFYYLMNMRHYAPGSTRDRFVRGRISTTSQDGWHCTQVRIQDRNHAGGTRLQSLPFNRWVDWPLRPQSGWMAGNNTSWLGYF